MKLLSIVVLILGIIALTSVLTVYWQIRQQDPTFLKEEFIPMDVKVEDHFGFNTDTDAIHFGKVPPQNEAIKSFNLTNTYQFAVVAELSIHGAIAPWVSATENTVYLEPNMQKKVNLTVTIPDATPYGQYYGTLRVVFRRDSP